MHRGLPIGKARPSKGASAQEMLSWELNMTLELTLSKKDSHKDCLMSGVISAESPAPGDVSNDLGARVTDAPAADAIAPILVKPGANADGSGLGEPFGSADSELALELRNPNTDRRAQNRALNQRRRHTHSIPLNWSRMGALIGVSYGASVLLAQTLVSPRVCALALISILTILVGARLARWERKEARPIGQIVAATALCVVLPHALAGLGYAMWTINEGLDIRLALGALVAMSAVSAALLMRRIPQLFASLAATWAPLALVDGSLLALGAMVLVGIAILVVSQLQIYVEAEDVTQVQARERARNRYEDILRDYEDTGQGWFWETDRRGLLSYASPIVAETIMRPPNDLIGRPFLHLFDLTDQSDESERTLSFHISARSSFQELAMRVAVADEERWWCVSGRPVYDDFYNFVGYRGSGTDLTEKRRSQQDASRLAHYDSLTGLANRFQMAQTLNKILDAPQDSLRECSVFLLDLDRFKQVNDTLGHPVGDALLKQVAQRLECSIGEMGRVGRLGGDEFKIIIPGRVGREKLGQLAYDIIHSLSQPYSIEGHRALIGASIGIAVSPEDGATSEALIRNSDLALYAAKDGGRGRYHFYSSDLHSAAEERAALENDLRDAIAQRGLELYYQPIVHTTTERITGFEALLRWNHPTKGWLSPAKFIPIAEDTGLISAIGEWAIRKACQDLALWPEEVHCAVNVSPLQFSNPQLPAVVTHALAQSGVSPSRLELEITESVFLNDSKSTDAMFAALKAVGVRLALDDFGTGYSSLSYLQKAPFDKIKIDQSFVRGATQSGSRNGAIIASITSLAQALGMDTTAEGVETMDELDLVRIHGCSHIQGYIYDRPLSSADAYERLEAGLQAVADGPRSARSPRQTMLRKVVLEHNGQLYDGTIRNISAQGVMIEGLWDVPAGTIFQIAMSESYSVTATARWSEGECMGVEFSKPMERDADGTFIAIKAASLDQEAAPLRPLRKANG